MTDKTEPMEEPEQFTVDPLAQPPNYLPALQATEQELSRVREQRDKLAEALRNLCEYFHPVDDGQAWPTLDYTDQPAVKSLVRKAESALKLVNGEKGKS